MNVGRQAAHLALLGIGYARARPSAPLVMAVGVGCVVAVLLAMVALLDSLRETIENTASTDRAIVLSDGAQFVGYSWLGDTHEEAILQASGVQRTSDGAPAVARDMRASVTMYGRADGVAKGVVIRGMPETGFAMRPNIQLVAGRMFRPGMHEVVVGRLAQAQFADADVGDFVRINDTPLEIVGEFRSDDWIESGFLADDVVVQSVLGRDGVHAVVVRLSGPAAFGTFRQSLVAHGALRFQVLREPDYYQRLIPEFGGYLTSVVATVAILMAIGGLFCIVNVASVVVGARVIDLATLEALGFRKGVLAASLLAETALVACIGALAGAAGAWLTVDGAVIVTGTEHASVIHQVEVGAVRLAEIVAVSIAVALLAALPAVFPGISRSITRRMGD